MHHSSITRELSMPMVKTGNLVNLEYKACSLFTRRYFWMPIWPVAAEAAAREVMVATGGQSILFTGPW